MVLGLYLDLLDHSRHLDSRARTRQRQQRRVAHLGAAQQVEQRILPLDRFAQHPLDFVRRHHVRIDPTALQALDLNGDSVPLAVESIPAHIINQPKAPPAFGEPQVGIVLTQAEAKLGPAGEHTIGFGHAPRYQVVDQHAQIAFVPARPPTILAIGLQRGIDARQQALGGSLFVARGAIDLTSKEQPADGARG